MLFTFIAPLVKFAQLVIILIFMGHLMDTFGRETKQNDMNENLYRVFIVFFLWEHLFLLDIYGMISLIV